MKIDKDRRSFDYSPFARKKGEKSFELQKEMREAARYAAKMLLLGKSSLEEIKKGTSKKFSLKGVLRNSDILAVLGERERTRRVLALLLKTPTRTLSGDTPESVLVGVFKRSASTLLVLSLSPSTANISEFRSTPFRENFLLVPFFISSRLLLPKSSIFAAYLAASRISFCSSKDFSPFFLAKGE